ncbi:hypothetical protein HWV62_40649 [Athelia sp. TMB]|nr:hypothetical protein HWV62_40649 [Athelia sp. TMB]
MASSTADRKAAYEKRVALADSRRKDGTWKRDGTGQQSDGSKENVAVSNVTRFCRSIANTALLAGGHKIAQIVFYQNGVGTGEAQGLLASVQASITGFGLNENVCEAYLWLASNFVPGDEIFLFGFSRGAYTARAIGGLIAHIGIIPKPVDSMESVDFQKVYAKYSKPGRNFKAEGITEEFGWKSMQTIKVIGVWDTVGSLGLPMTSNLTRSYAFHDTTISGYVENAFHALSLDERRASFYPTLWSLPTGKEPYDRDFIYIGGARKCNLKQCWFPGDHSDVGGSHADAKRGDFSDIALAWMVDQCRGLLAFDEPASFLVPNSLWAAQPIHDFRFTDVSGLAGTRYRAPGEYVDPNPGGKAAHHSLTNETIHPSVRMRFLKSATVKPAWAPVALNGFRLTRTTGTPPRWEWVKTVGKEQIKLLEDQTQTEADSWGARLMTPEDKRTLASDKLTDNLKKAIDTGTVLTHPVATAVGRMPGVGHAVNVARLVGGTTLNMLGGRKP